MPPLRHLLAVTALTASVATAAPQVDVLASGLSNPRGIAFAPNGQLFVTEPGAAATAVAPCSATASSPATARPAR